MTLFRIVKSLQGCDNAKLTLSHARAGKGQPTLDSIDRSKHAEKVLAIPSLLLCRFKILLVLALPEAVSPSLCGVHG